MSQAPVLDVSGLHLRLRLGRQEVDVVTDAGFRVGAGETLALVGESGCGKSLTALALMRLLPRPALRLAGGAIRLDGRDLAPLAEAAMRRLRGSAISMIFQDPIGALNPVVPVGAQVAEMLVQKAGLGGAAARARAIELLASVINQCKIVAIRSG
jgi:ABC-type microcin C transport system duplicated ATPase subunit YejF